MRRLRDSVAVKCPIDQAQARIERFFAERRGADGKLRLPLRAPFGRASIEGFALDREVCVDASISRDDQKLDDPIHVSWKAEGDIPLPSFVGTIVTWGEGNRNVTFIQLEGTYVEPLGGAGAIFDEALGRKNAQRTAKDLLAQIAAAIDDKPAASVIHR